MKKYWLPALVVVVIGTIVWSGAYLTSERAALNARVSHLHALLESRVGIDLDAIEKRLDELETPDVDEDRVLSIISRTQELESRLDYPVIHASEAAEYMGQYVAVYGVAEARISGRNMFIDFRNADFNSPWFNLPSGFNVEDINRSAGILVVGEVEEYQGSPQIIIRSSEQLFY